MGEAAVIAAQGWRDQLGDIWFEGTGELLHSFETAPFPREHVERKWGPLTPSIEVDLDHLGGERVVTVGRAPVGRWAKSTDGGVVTFVLACQSCATIIGPQQGLVNARAAFAHHWLHAHA